MEKHPNKLIQPFLPLKTSVMPLVEVIISFVIAQAERMAAEPKQTKQFMEELRNMKMSSGRRT